jgi:hypothetical protein
MGEEKESKERKEMVQKLPNVLGESTVSSSEVNMVLIPTQSCRYRLRTRVGRIELVLDFTRSIIRPALRCSPSHYRLSIETVAIIDSLDLRSVEVPSRKMRPLTTDLGDARLLRLFLPSLSLFPRIISLHLDDPVSSFALGRPTALLQLPW